MEGILLKQAVKMRASGDGEPDSAIGDYRTDYKEVRIAIVRLKNTKRGGPMDCRSSCANTAAKQNMVG